MLVRPKMDTCPQCESGTLEDALYTTSREVTDRTYVGEVPSWKCSSCSGEFIWGPGLVSFDLAVAVQLIADGIRTGAAHTFCRKSMAMTYEEVAALYSIDPEDVPFLEEPDIYPADRYWDLLIPRVQKAHDEHDPKINAQLVEA